MAQNKCRAIIKQLTMFVKELPFSIAIHPDVRIEANHFGPIPIGLVL